MRFLDDASNARDRRVRVISELFTSACYTFEHKWKCTALDPYLWFSTSHRKWNREIQHSVYCRSPHPDQQQGWVPIPCVWRQLRVSLLYLPTHRVTPEFHLLGTPCLWLQSNCGFTVHCERSVNLLRFHDYFRSICIRKYGFVVRCLPAGFLRYLQQFNLIRGGPKFRSALASIVFSPGLVCRSSYVLLTTRLVCELAFRVLVKAAHT